MSDPLQSGLAAGQAAYNGATPSRMGISAADLSGLQKTVTSGLTDAAAQRKILDTNAAKQAAGKYSTSGTSAGLYNYMHDRGGYPVNAVPSGQPVNTGGTSYGGAATQVLPTTTKTTTPIQKPYETNVNVGTTTQAGISNTAANSGTKMGKVTQPTVNMPKPSMVNQLLATAGPVALGYYALDKFGGLDALGKGWDKLFGSDALPAGFDASSVQALTDQYYTYPSVNLASAGSEDALQIYADRVAAEKAAAEAAARAAAADASAGAYTGAGNVIPTTGGAGLTEAANAGATYGTNLAGTEALGEGASSAAAASGAATGADLSQAYDLGEATTAGAVDAASQEAAASELGFDSFSTMVADYGPEIAAAMVLDQLTGGNITKGVGNVISGALDTAGDIIGGIGDAGQDFWDSIFAEGGQVKGYADGGISVGSRPDPNIDGISQAAPDVSFQPTVGRFASGGISHLGGYSDGGRLLRGPGDGVSDSIPATISGKQPARLADGEFVVPARIVSELGNGSTEAGARKLYAMMDRVQKARGKTVGKGKVAKNTRADKYLPG